ncbi:hypothetical protein [Actinomadura sp. 21ATH]|uniref:hypothetical protein n=1 Tax=Actinomadura sp. 21ATH TaxID=1735444 RepID=UPI0035BF2F1D
MSPLVAVLLLAAGLSEAAGRILPLVSRRSGMSPHIMVGLLLIGAVVESAVIALWPVTAWALAGLVASAPPPGPAPSWTPGLIAPLLLAAVLAFPLLGPLLHLLLLVGVGAGLAAPLAAAAGLGWWAAAGCLALAGFGLAAAVDAVRRLFAAVLATSAQEPLT